MSELLRLAALEVTFGLVFTVLALCEVTRLRRQSKQLLRQIEISRLEAPSLATLSVAHASLRRSYSQARALIHLTGEFNQVMEFRAVLDRLSHGLSRFFAGDDVAIWICSTGGDLELAAGVRHDVASLVGPDAAWLRSVIAQGSAVIPSAWQQAEKPWMAAPLLDWRGIGLGVVVLTSHRRSRLDALTGLGNRGDFDRALHEATARALLTAGSLSVLLADVDHFKYINDSRGHPEGDRVLRHVAQLIAQAAGEPNRAFRIGGEEFAVLLPQAKAAAVSVAVRLCVRAGQEAFFGDSTRLTLSLGVASLPDDGQDPATVMAAADQALYRAKAAGRNRVHAA